MSDSEEDRAGEGEGGEVEALTEREEQQQEDEEGEAEAEATEAEAEVPGRTDPFPALRLELVEAVNKERRHAGCVPAAAAKWRVARACVFGAACRTHLVLKQLLQ
jgi:hypothetical protein